MMCIHHRIILAELRQFGARRQPRKALWRRGLHARKPDAESWRAVEAARGVLHGTALDRAEAHGGATIGAPSRRGHVVKGHVARFAQGAPHASPPKGAPGEPIARALICCLPAEASPTVSRRCGNGPCVILALYQRSIRDIWLNTGAGRSLKFEGICCMKLERVWRWVRVFLAGGELRSLKRQLPNAHRLWVRADRTLRQETDREYCARLRLLAQERSGLREP